MKRYAMLVQNARRDYLSNLYKVLARINKKFGNVARGHDDYVSATINHGHPWNHFAQGAFTGTPFVLPSKSQKTNSGAALGFRMVENDEQCSASTG